MVNKRWTYSNKSVYNVGYHLIWCTKYRRKVLVGKIKRRLLCMLKQKAKQFGVEISTYEIMQDHIHLFVKSSTVDAPHFIVQQLNGYTSHILREEFGELKTRIPSLWTRSYYCESVGHISEAAVKKYIEDQKTNDQE